MSGQESIRAALTLVEGPEEEPISVADLKGHLRLTSGFTPDDEYLTLMIATARRECEATMRRAFIQQTWRLSLKNWPGRDYGNLSSQPDLQQQWDHIKLPFPPLQSVTGVVYTDTQGTQFTMPQGAVIGTATTGNAALSGAYNVFLDFEPGRIYLPFAQIWPTNILLPGAPIQITYVVGYEDAPTFLDSFEGASAVCHAMKMMAGFWYENRIPPSEMRKSSISAALNFIVDELLTPFRVWD